MTSSPESASRWPPPQQPRRLVLLRAVHQESISVRVSCLLFVVAAAAGTMLSVGLMNAFSNLLHGDGALGLVLVPLAGAL